MAKKYKLHCFKVFELILGIIGEVGFVWVLYCLVRGY